NWSNDGINHNLLIQGNCGASYAFSAVGALEGAWALAFGNLVTLSEQNIIDCSVPYGNYGCRGGNMYNAFQYIVANDGIDSSDSYPYSESQYSCRYSQDDNGAQMSGCVCISSGSEDDLQMALAYIGPLSVAVDASNNAFKYYSGGVYSSTQCSSSYLTHAMLVTGYGTYNGVDYYLSSCLSVLNSWGENWGSSGYIMMARNKYNQCGIATDASYPTL
ncbi:Cathepsin L, partial [Geodia barretti]